MATITAIGTNQNKWVIEGAVSGGSLSGVGSYAYSTTPWTTQNNRFVMTSLQEANSFALMFFGTDAVLEKGLARIWGVSAVFDPSDGTDDYLGSFLADVEVVLGATSTNTGIFGTGGPYFFADKINVLDDATDTPPGIRVFADTPASSALMLFDSVGFSTIIVEVENSTSSKIGLLWRVL